MKHYRYLIRSVVGSNERLYYEFVRVPGDLILRISDNFELVYAFAEGYTFANNIPFDVECAL